MAKRIALMDSVEVDGEDLSSFCRSVEFTSEHAREDVSGFNPTGASEYLAGVTTQSVTCEFFGGYATGEPHTVLYTVHRDREVVDFAWRHDQNAAVSATNPELRGQVQILSYSPGATRGDVEAFPVEFTAADETGLQFYDTAAA